jgi:valyl-tRNA synthetase
MPEGHAVFFHIQTQSEAVLFESQLPTIVALTKGCKSVKVLRNLKDIPAGCGCTVLTPTVAIYVLLRVSVAKALLIVTC